MQTYQEADCSIAAYDAFIFTSVGRSWNASKADALAAVAIVDCEQVCKDRKLNVVTKNYYKQMMEFLLTQINS